MRVLLTGHRGYIGSVLTPQLLQAGHDVIGLDSDLYERCTFPQGGVISDVPTILKDTRDVEISDFKGFDAVLHLAALSNDPLGNLKPGLTDDINHRASVRIAELAKKAGVRRFVFASSCSNYGKAGEGMIDETGALNPVTAYGEFEGHFRTKHRATCRRRFLSGLSAAGHSLRRVAADAVRHRPEQSRRLGDHDGEDSPEVGRHAVAPDRAHRGYFARVHRSARGAGRCRVQRGVQRRPDRSQLSDPRSGGDRRRASFPAAPSNLPTTRRRIPVPIVSASRRSEPGCRSSSRNGMPRRVPNSSTGSIVLPHLTLEDFEGPRYQRIGHIKKLVAEGRLDGDLRRTASLEPQ